MTVKALMPVRIVNLVPPLAHQATDMHTTDTAATAQARSGAAAPLIGHGLRQGSLHSGMGTLPTPGIATSTTATATTTTSPTRAVLWPSADWSFNPSILWMRVHRELLRPLRPPGQAAHATQARLAAPPHPARWVVHRRLLPGNPHMGPLNAMARDLAYAACLGFAMGMAYGAALHFLPTWIY